MIQKNIFIIAAIIPILLLSACSQIEPKELSKKISTRAGGLTLEYENWQAALTGFLQRATPCVNWTVQAGGTKDLPRSEITIKIFDSNKGAICIQMVGEPQEIKEAMGQVSENTIYTVKFEDETIFSGKLGE